MKSILLKAYKDVFNIYNGESSTGKKGTGYDFTELREYRSGDNTRNIDWIISAKFMQTFVKVFEEKKELNIVIVPLLGASVYFGLQNFKQDYIAEICALLSFSSVKQKNPFSSYIVSDKTTLVTKRSNTLSDVKLFTKKVLYEDVLGKSIKYRELSKTLYRQVKQKSLIFLIGDFLSTDGVELSLLGKKHELICIVVRDRFEEKPVALGKINIIDPQTQKKSFVSLDKNTSLLIEKKVKKHDEKLFGEFRKAGIKFIKIYTDEEALTKILTLMKSR
jgi:uncharacterized protein (DUF58 family)